MDERDAETFLHAIFGQAAAARDRGIPFDMGEAVTEGLVRIVRVHGRNADREFVHESVDRLDANQVRRVIKAGPWQSAEEFDDWLGGATA